MYSVIAVIGRIHRAPFRAFWNRRTAAWSIPLVNTRPRKRNAVKGYAMRGVTMKEQQKAPANRGVVK